MRAEGEVAELAEGDRLLSDYRGKTSITGSNPVLSAILAVTRASAAGNRNGLQPRYRR